MISVISKIAKARGSFEDIKKDVKGYDYMYADLDGIMKAVNKGLIENGLHVYHTFEPISLNNTPYLSITCHVADGESEIVSTIPLSLSGIENGRSSAQEMGKILTYGRRYSLAAVLGLTADQDTDAQPPRDQRGDSRASQAKPQSSIRNYSDKPAPQAIAKPVTKPSAKALDLPKPSEKKFVDSPVAWEWLQGLFVASNVDAIMQEEIKKTAVGRTTSDLQEEIKRQGKPKAEELR